MKIWKRLVACITMAMLLFTPITVMRASASDTSKSITVTYGQTEARSMLDLINDFRTSDEAWIWDTNDQDVIKYDNLSNLTYDPILEKVTRKSIETAVAVLYGVLVVMVIIGHNILDIGYLIVLTIYLIRLFLCRRRKKSCK